MGFWDVFGKFQKAPPARPDTREIARAALTDRWSPFPSRGLTPSSLARYLDQADGGDLYYQAWLFREFEEKDAHLASLLHTRSLAVLGLEWQLQPASEEPADEKIAEFCREALDALNMQELMLHLLSAVGYGYAVSELIWQTGPRWTVARVEEIPAHRVTYINSLTPRLITESNWAGEEIPPYKAIYHRHRGKSGLESRGGVLRACAFMYLLKNYALKDWAIFNEVYGMPLRLGKYDPSASPADRSALVDAIRSIGTDAAGIISKTTEIEFVEAGQRLSGQFNPYQTLAEFCNREMSKAVLGQTLTTDTTGATGTYAAGKVHEAVRWDILEADAEALAATLTEQLVAPLVGFNFGWDKPRPRYEFALKEEEDLKSLAETYKIVVDMGYPVTVEHIAERFGIPLPQEGQEVVGGVGQGPPGAPVNEPPAPEGEPGEPEPEGGSGADTGQDPEAARAGGGGTALQAGGLDWGPGDDEAVTSQAWQEALAQAALGAAGPAIEALLAPVKDLIDSGATLGEVRERLLALFPTLPAEGLADILYEAQMRAYMRGREVEHGR